MRCALVLAATAAFACSGAIEERREAERRGAGTAREEPTEMVISVVGTNDLHGHIERLPVLSGFVANLRRAREADGGAVLLVDGGDMFQGTLESNLVEGASVVRGMNTLGYVAAAVGNHEFDFGPAGERTTPASETHDPRGALKERAGEAAFPLLTANILVAATGERVDWHPNMPPTATTRVGDLVIGFIGVSTAETLDTTIAANVADLRMRPLAETIVEHGRRLRDDGAAVVIVTAHAGGHCHDFSDPDVSSECDQDEEIFELARALPRGAVDLVVAGHSHQGVAHRVNGIPIIESYAYGRAFGRVDLRVDSRAGRIVETTIHPPRPVCGGLSVPLDECEPGDYEGGPVVPDERVVRLVAADTAVAEGPRQRPLGVRVSRPLPQGRGEETALGNLVADLMREARPADVAIMNGGGLRAPLPAGDLTYGQFYEMFPFDNRFARVRITGAELVALLADNLGHDRGIFTVSGVRVTARCVDDALEVRLRREGGRPIRDDEELTLVVSDFLATTSNSVFRSARADGRVEVEDGPPMREALVEMISRRRSVSGEDQRLLGRLELPSPRPVRCD